MAPRIHDVSRYLMVFMIFCELHGGECFLLPQRTQQTVNVFQKIQINKSSNNLSHRNATKNLNCKIINISNLFYIRYSVLIGLKVKLYLGQTKNTEN